jgi:hypothetical protein
MEQERKKKRQEGRWGEKRKGGREGRKEYIKYKEAREGGRKEGREGREEKGRKGGIYEV